MKRKSSTPNRLAPVLRLQALVMWAVLSLLFIAGERAPETSISTFLALKGAAMCSLAACLYTAHRLHRAGRLPEIAE